MRFSRVRFAPVLVGVLWSAPAFAGFANEFALFGGNSLRFNGYAWVSGGPVGSNGDVHSYGPASVELDSLYVGGNLNPDPPVATPSHITAHGNVIVNGSAAFGAFTEIHGTLHAGGDVRPGGSSTYHNGVVAGGSLLGGGIPGNYNTYGQVLVGGDITFGSGNKVNGTTGSNGNIAAGLSNTFTGQVTNPGTFTMDSFSTNPGGRVVGSVNPQPQRAATVDLPPATSFISGGAAVSIATFQNLPLAPGSYGALTMASSSRVSLTSGTYRFDSIAATGTFQDLYLDITNGPINIFVTGDVSFSRVQQHVNGVQIIWDDEHVIDRRLAADVYMESHGNVNLTGNFFGTIYTPHGDITTGTIGSITGSLVAGDELIIGSSNDVASTFVPSAYLAAAVPEPGVLGLSGAAAIGLLMRRWRKPT